MEKGWIEEEVKHLTSSADMFPTLASLFGLKISPNLYYGKTVINDQSHVLYADFSIYDGERVYSSDQKDLPENIKNDLERINVFQNILRTDYFRYRYNEM